ncbi:hypothetical protein C2E23DRAFT_886929 [Lenzites betulinus]|nr:hypothetical protein C2E23DRAFT_886929 [Lenzites betulinus]
MHLPPLTALIALALAGAPSILGATVQRAIPARVQPVSDALVPHKFHINAASVPLHTLAMKHALAGVRKLPPTPCKLQHETGFVSVQGKGIQGFISRLPNEAGMYGLAQNKTADDALKVVLKRCRKGFAFEIGTLNGMKNFTLLGAATAVKSVDDDLAHGSNTTVFLTGVASVSIGPAQEAPNGYTAVTGIPRRDAESFIWDLSTSGELEFLWTNTYDAFAQGTTMLYVPDDDAFVVTADVALLDKELSSPVPVTLRLISV